MTAPTTPTPATEPRTGVSLLVATLLISLIAAAVGFAATTLSEPADAQGAVAGVGNGVVDWRGWTFLYDSPWSFDHTNPDPTQDTRLDGLALARVNFQGLPILSRASFPVMNVYYEDVNGNPTVPCGPYADRLGQDEAQEPQWREFVDPNGVTWLEIGIEAQIGAYFIYQAYYFSETGIMDTHLFSGGLQCDGYHEHLPFMRLDFDLGVNGAAGDRIMRSTPDGVVVESFEFARPATDAMNHEWWIQDAQTGDAVLISFDDGSYMPPNSSRPVTGVIPETQYVKNNVYGLAYNDAEQDWGPNNPLAALRTVPPEWLNGQSIDQTDNVLWYTGWMPHAPEEAAGLWHSTGLRLSLYPGGEPLGAQPAPSTATCDGLPVTVDLNFGQLPTAFDDVILGTPGNDAIAAQSGNDVICGGGGDDKIWGQAGDDTIWGEAGNDKLRGGDGDDHVFGGSGFDDLDGGRGNDEVDGGADADVKVRGGTGDDLVRGGDGDDVLVAGNGGVDVVTGDNGNDKITGGPRPDTLWGGPGDDEILGHGGADELIGQEGNDTLVGGKQSDMLFGGDGFDRCAGGTTGLGATEADQAFDCEEINSVP